VYLSALSIGGAWGLAEGLRKTPSTAPPKIRLNACLNAVTRRGPFLGNSAGVVALVYNGINSYIGYARGKRTSNPVEDKVLSAMANRITQMMLRTVLRLEHLLEPSSRAREE
jgi:import inner membrane translocase subunit TIM23